MTIIVKGKKYMFQQSHIDPSVWVIVRSAGDIVPKGAGPRRPADEEATPLHDTFSSDHTESAAFGYIVIYVGDFLIISDDPFIDAVRDKLQAKWKITDKPTAPIWQRAQH